MIIDGITTNDKGETLPDFTYKEAVETAVQAFCGGLKLRPHDFVDDDDWLYDKQTKMTLSRKHIAFRWDRYSADIRTTVWQHWRLLRARKAWLSWRSGAKDRATAPEITKAAAKAMLLNKAARDARLPSD